MITKFNKYNESIRDKMTPKSEEDVKKAYINIINKLDDNPLTGFPIEYTKELSKIAKLFDESLFTLELISGYDDDYNLLNEFFESLVEDQKKINIRIKQTETIDGGDWKCYPNVKLAHWSPDDFGEVGAWIYCKDFINKIK